MTRIVLADDHAFLRAGVEGALRTLGMDVVASVEDGVAALAAIASENPDLVILDLRMPNMDGVQTLKAMRAQDDNRPVILLTAEIDDASLVEAARVKANGIVFKHGAENVLERAIRRVMSGERYLDMELMDRTLSLAAAESQPSVHEKLSKREFRIAMAVAEGKRNKEIAAEIGTTEGAVKIYLHRIFEKLSVKNRTELALLIFNTGNYLS